MLPLTIANSLPATKTHKSRGFAFVATPTEDHLGRLTITQGRQLDTYLLDEVHQQDPSLRVIQLAHTTEQSEYEVAFLPSGMALCSGMYCGKHATCKHRDALKAMLAQIELALVPEETPWDSRDNDAEALAMDAYLAACSD